MLRHIAVSFIFLGLAARLPAQESLAGDEAYLRTAGIATDSAGLADYLGQQIPSEKLQRRIDLLINDLKGEPLPPREEATRQLVALGRPALPVLRDLLAKADVTQAARIQNCLNQIERTPHLTRLATTLRLFGQRPTADAAKLLLDFYPHAGEEWLEEEVLAALGALLMRQGQADPILLAALQDASPSRRAVAACVLGRHGVEFRDRVRPLLDDPDPSVRRHAVQGLVGDIVSRSADRPGAEDEAFLRQAGIAPDALAGFFRKRTLLDQDLKRMEQLIRQLGSDRFQEREDASQLLMEAGASVLSLLREASRSQDPEVVRRVEACITQITKHPGPALPAAAARLLARQASADALGVLIRFVPFTDDAHVEDEVLTAMAILSVRSAQLDQDLLAALKDDQARRRGAAAWVIAQVGAADHLAKARPLLQDPHPEVRFRAAQGFLLARDRAALPALIGLLDEGPFELAGQVELLLHGLAKVGAPSVALTPETRKACRTAWSDWWLAQGAKLDLSAARSQRHLGLTLVAELTGTNAGGNRVAELGRDGQPRWTLTGLAAPIDAQLLGGGRVLVAEHNASRVSERDLKGNILWEKSVVGNPVACQRLANGNTFIATYNNVLEVTPAGAEVFNFNPNPTAGGVIYDARKLANGNVVCISGRGTLLELDQAGKQVRSLPISNQGGWAGVTPLPGGRFLVALLGPGRVLEVDGDGKVLWEAAVPTAAHAIRLPSGNTLVACMNAQRLVEINPAGSVVWEQKTPGRPFHISRR